MKIIHVDPDVFAKIDRKSNIIMCIPENEKKSLIELEDFPDTYGITLPRDLNLSADNIVRISAGTLAATHRPKIKICHPVGIKLQFNEFVDNHNLDIFQKIFRSFASNIVLDKDSNIDHHLITDITFIMYLDTIRIRESGLQMFIKKDTQISNFYFTWYVQTIKGMPAIDEIYIIQDDHVYEEFHNIF